MIVANDDYLAIVDQLAIVVPVSTTDRRWPNHIALDGAADVDGWAMTEQVRTVSRQRLAEPAGRVSSRCLAQIETWLADFLTTTS